MQQPSQSHHRHSIRLKGYDYSQPGAYFSTVVTAARASLFGDIADGNMHVNETGEIVLAVWRDLPNHYPFLQLGTFVVMPNHVHGIVVLTVDVGAGLRPAPTDRPAPTIGDRYGLPEIVRAFKSFSARRVNAFLGKAGHSLWQRNYYEHVIRDEREWERLHRYIESNPSQWEQDHENPANPAK